YGVLQVPKADETLYIVHNWGDRNCPTNWTSWNNNYYCTPGIPAGAPIPENQIEQTKTHFQTYITERMKLLEDPKVGGNPYNVEVVSGWAEDIKEYDPWKENSKFNVEYFAHHGATPMKESVKRIRGPPW